MSRMVNATPSSAVHAHGRWIVMASIAGLLTGALTLAGQGVLPGEANRLANSGAIWVTVAFLVGTRTHTDTTAALAGLVTLLAALVGYFAAAAAAGAGVSVSTVAIWTGTALVGGPVFGVAGRWWAMGTDRKAALSVAALGGVYVAEGLWTLLMVPHMMLAGWVSVGVGIVLVLLLPRDGRTRVRALVLLPALTLVGVLGFAAIDRVFSSL